jgi:hypothetical protein
MACRKEAVHVVSVRKAIKSLLLVEAATGWPNQKQKQQIYQAVSPRFPDGGPIQRVKLPFKPEEILVQGMGLNKSQTYIWYRQILSWDVKENRVILRLTPSHRFGTNSVLILFTMDMDAAFQLGKGIDSKEVNCLEVNDTVTGMLIGPEWPTRRFTVHGMAGLPGAARELLLRHGIEPLAAEGTFEFKDRVPREVEELVARLSAP